MNYFKFLLVASVTLAFLWPLSGTSFPTHGNMGGAYFEYDVVVDLADPGALGADNACDAFATAVRPYIAAADNTVNHNVLVHGTADIYWDDFYEPGGAYDFHRCFFVGPTTAFDTTSTPLTDHAEGDAATATTASLNIHFDGARLNVDMDDVTHGTQDTPAIVFMLGNQYGYGSTAGTIDTISGHIAGPIKISGHLAVYTMDPTEEGNFNTELEFPVPPYTTGNANASDLTMIGMMVNGARHVDMSDYKFSAVGISGSVDDDDIGMVSMYNNGIIPGSHYLYYQGVGHVVYGYAGRFWSGSIAGNKFGLLLGDPVNGGDIVPTTNCEDDCTVIPTEVRYLSSDETLLVESNTFNTWIWDASDINLDNILTEHSGAATQVGVCIGAGVESGDANRPCCTDDDAAANCNPTALQSIVNIDWGKGKPISDRTNTSWKALALGANCGFSTSPHQSKIDFTRAVFYDTDHDLPTGVDTYTNPLFNFDDDTAVCYVELDSRGWRHEDDAPPDLQTPHPLYDNVRFIDSVKQDWGVYDANMAAGDIDGTACLRVSHHGLGPHTACNTFNNIDAIIIRMPFIGDAYIHDCIVYLPLDLDHGNALDHVDLQFEVLDKADICIAPMGEIFEIWDDNAACGGARNCADGEGIYTWEVRGDARIAEEADAGGNCDGDMTEGVLQLSIQDTTVDTGAAADNTLYVTIDCNISIP